MLLREFAFERSEHQPGVWVYHGVPGKFGANLRWGVQAQSVLPGQPPGYLELGGVHFCIDVEIQFCVELHFYLEVVHGLHLYIDLVQCCADVDGPWLLSCRMR